MWLEYGVTDDGELRYIGDVPRGRTKLKCPYCGGVLTAKKGEIKAAHFAHTGETCRQVGRDDDAVGLPAYDNFNLRVPGKVLADLRKFADDPHGGPIDRQRLEAHELIAFNEWAGRGGSYELTKKGKLILSQLSLDLFNKFQEPLITARYEELEARATALYERTLDDPFKLDSWLAQGLKEVATTHRCSPVVINRLHELRLIAFDENEFDAPVELTPSGEQVWQRLIALETDIPSGLDLETALTDLRLYRQQWRRILSLTLYFLAIDGGRFYKIGVTARDLAERLAEIRADLTANGIILPNVQILGTWIHRGNVERYFKYRYASHGAILGPLTEYYTFDDPKAVLRDLRRMQPKELSDLERAILAEQPSAIEVRIAQDTAKQRRSAAIRSGMRRAANEGIHIGRPGENRETFLAKYPTVVQALAAGMSINKTARVTGITVSTVYKVHTLLKHHEE